MDKKGRIYIVVTGVVAITLIWLSQSNQNQAPELDIPVPTLPFVETNESLNTLEGVLWSSDDEEKGNLMLVSGKTTVYIRTTRDFSNLVGKYVIASIGGTLDNFILLNIEENLAKDGFIQVN